MRAWLCEWKQFFSGSKQPNITVYLAQYYHTQYEDITYMYIFLCIYTVRRRRDTWQSAVVSLCAGTKCRTKWFCNQSEFNITILQFDKSNEICCQILCDFNLTYTTNIFDFVQNWKKKFHRDITVSQCFPVAWSCSVNTVKSNTCLANESCCVFAKLSRSELKSVNSI